jgi:hypothetical protein
MQDEALAATLAKGEVKELGTLLEHLATLCMQRTQTLEEIENGGVEGLDEDDVEGLDEETEEEKFEKSNVLQIEEDIEATMVLITSGYDISVKIPELGLSSLTEEEKGGGCVV